MRSFDALCSNGRLFVAPILQTLILNRAPKVTIDWADKVASWDFHQIIPCHFKAPIEATPNQFRQAFAFLEKDASHEIQSGGNRQLLPDEDFELLKELDKELNKLGIVPPPKDKV